MGKYLYINGENINMSEVEKMLLELYNNDNISIGVHGTGILPDKEQKNAKDTCKEGLMCRYGDIRRTVALQDRGLIHAHGNISFEQLISYGYDKGLKGYLYEQKQEDRRTYYVPKEINLEHCSFIVAIPKEIKTTDEEIFSGQKRIFKMEYARSEEELRLGKYKELMGRPIDPKYIVGYYMNGDISTFEYNNIFYGFKEGEKENDFPELDLEKIQRENETIKQKNAERNEKSAQELGKETIEEQKKTNFKKVVSDILTRLTSLIRMNQDRMRDD